MIHSYKFHQSTTTTTTTSI